MFVCLFVFSTSSLTTCPFSHFINSPPPTSSRRLGCNKHETRRKHKQYQRLLQPPTPPPPTHHGPFSPLPPPSLTTFFSSFFRSLTILSFSHLHGDCCVAINMRHNGNTDKLSLHPTPPPPHTHTFQDLSFSILTVFSLSRLFKKASGLFFSSSPFKLLLFLLYFYLFLGFTRCSPAALWTEPDRQNKTKNNKNKTKKLTKISFSYSANHFPAL